MFTEEHEGSSCVWLTFSMDDGDVSIHDDYLLTDADPAATVTELTTRITQIVDDAYPLLMRTLWG